MGKHVCKEEQIKLITECRTSGLSDYRWCEQKGIHPGNFYNWVSKLKKKGYTFPDSASKTKPVPEIQDVVKLEIASCDEYDSSIVKQSRDIIPDGNIESVAAELIIGNITLRLYNGADERIIHNTIQSIGGISHAW